MMPATLTCTGNTVARHRSDRSPGGSQSVATQRAAGEHTLSTVRIPVFSVSPSTGQGKHVTVTHTGLLPAHTNDRSLLPAQAKESTVTHTVYRRPVSSQHIETTSLSSQHRPRKTLTHTVFKRPVRLLPCTGQGKHCDTYRLQTTGLLPPPTNDRSPPSSYKRPVSSHPLQTTGLLPAPTNDRSPPSTYKRPVSSQHLQTTGLLPAPTNDRSPPRTGQAEKPHTSALH